MEESIIEKPRAKGILLQCQNRDHQYQKHIQHIKTTFQQLPHNAHIAWKNKKQKQREN
jgi:hypothetical protein